MTSGSQRWCCYTNSPATYMWEPINEAQATNSDGSCSESAAAAALRQFYDVIGGTIQHDDPAHRVEAGLLGEGNCGTANGDFSYVGASAGIDVLSYHDYYPAGDVRGWRPMERHRSSDRASRRAREAHPRGGGRHCRWERLFGEPRPASERLRLAHSDPRFGRDHWDVVVELGGDPGEL